jgi:hypothetical protein
VGRGRRHAGGRLRQGGQGGPGVPRSLIVSVRVRGGFLSFLILSVTFGKLIHIFSVEQGML